MIKKAYKFRFYPTAEQERQLAHTFGCVRFVYNWALRLRSDAWYNEQKRIGYHESSGALTALKKNPEYFWLNEISCVPTQQTLRHLQTGFKNFWDGRAKVPDIQEEKHAVQSAEYTRSAFKWVNGQLTLAKHKEPLNIRWSRDIPDKPTTVTVHQGLCRSLLCLPAFAMPMLGSCQFPRTPLELTLASRMPLLPRTAGNPATQDIPTRIRQSWRSTSVV